MFPKVLQKWVIFRIPRARARARARRQNGFCSRNTYKPAMYGIPQNDPF